MIGEYERAFYGSQYASMAPLFEHYGVQLWMPEVGGRVDWRAEDHEQAMLVLGLSSKREITRTRIRVRTAMAAQTREQGRYLGGRPPYGYRLADAGPHPTRRTPRGAAGHTGSSPIRSPRRWCDGCSPSGWPGTAWRASPAPSTMQVSRARPPPTRNGTRTALVRGGRCARWRRSWPTRGTPAGRCGTDTVLLPGQPDALGGLPLKTLQLSGAHRHVRAELQRAPQRRHARSGHRPLRRPGRRG